MGQSNHNRDGENAIPEYFLNTDQKKSKLTWEKNRKDYTKEKSLLQTELVSYPLTNREIWQPVE